MRFPLLKSLLFPVLLLPMGCGGGVGDAPPLARVKGMVKFGGEPLPDATVVFRPKEGGAHSAGRTDASGNYELTYSRTEKGAKLGEHIIEVTTYKNKTDDAEGVPEKIPTKYNTKSELVRTVENKDNVIDLELETTGEVVQPPKNQ